MGKFKDARAFQENLAKLAIKDFETYRAVINFEITDLPKEVIGTMMKNTLKYKIYRAFTSKTSAEKELYKMNKKYMKDMKAQNKKFEPQRISFNECF